MVVGIPIVIALIGIMMFVLAVNPKLQRIGEIMLFAGLLAGLLQLKPDMIPLFH
jgi:hypothetical protein